MIKECNFKQWKKKRENLYCSFKNERFDQRCSGEENCILYQIYKNTEIDDSICYENRFPSYYYGEVNPIEELESKKKTTKEGTKRKGD